MHRNPHAIQKSRSGFTLIELVAATAMAAMLSITAMYVIGTIRQHPKGLSQGPRPEAWTRRVEEQLRWDLSQAVLFRADGNGLTLAGYDSLEAGTRFPTHRPVTVLYVLKSIGNDAYLIREQTSLDTLKTADTFSEFVLAKVKKFQITTLPEVEDSESAAVEDKREIFVPVSFAQLQTMGKCPRSVRLIIECADSPGPVLDTVAYLK